MKTPTPAQSGHRARKRFGQNFLVDHHVINNIIAAIDVKPDDHVVEIGPGLGALTDAMIKLAGHLSVIEIDKDLAERLDHRYANEQHFSLRRGDALKTDFAKITSAQAIRIVGNLPYNISTPLLFHLLKYRTSISDMYFMLQKEVVDRLAAQPNNKNYGRLSVMMQYHCQIQALFTVPPAAFNPAPRVTSAVVHLVPHVNPPHKAVDMNLFERLVKSCFQQRRKTLRNSLKVFSDGTIDLPGSDVDLNARPETLSVAEFVSLSNRLSKAM